MFECFLQNLTKSRDKAVQNIRMNITGENLNTFNHEPRSSHNALRSNQYGYDRSKRKWNIIASQFNLWRYQISRWSSENLLATIRCMCACVCLTMAKKILVVTTSGTQWCSLRYNRRVITFSREKTRVNPILSPGYLGVHLAEGLTDARQNLDPKNVVRSRLPY